MRLLCFKRVFKSFGNLMDISFNRIREPVSASSVRNNEDNRVKQPSLFLIQRVCVSMD